MRFRLYHFEGILYLSLLFVGLGGCGRSSENAAGQRRAEIFPNPPEMDSTSVPLPAASTAEVPAGTPITVEVSDVIDSDTSTPGLFIHCKVDSDVKGRDGKVAIPARSSGVIAVLDSGKRGGNSYISLALYQLTIDGKSYLLNRGIKELAQLEMSERSADGAGHRSVHLESRSVLVFVLAESIQFKK